MDFKFSEFTFSLLFLFFPGLICSYVYDALTSHKPRVPFFYVLQCFCLGLASYFIYWVALTLLHCPFEKLFLITLPTDVIFLTSLKSGHFLFSCREIVFVSLVALLLALVLSYIDQHKLIHNFARRFGISRCIGELDIWGFTFNLRFPDGSRIHWITVRDLRNNFTYDGWVSAYSDNSADAELLLRDVVVYNSTTGATLYQVDAMYISRKREDISIELRELSGATTSQSTGESNAQA